MRPRSYLTPKTVRGRIARPQPLGLPLINMGFNELPYPPTRRVAQALSQTSERLGSYGSPGCEVLRAKLAELWGLSADRLICGNGSEELLDVIARNFVRAGDEIVISEYGYIQFELTAHRLGARLTKAPERNLRTDIDALLETITPGTRLVFLANPNNPTGTYLPRSEVKRLHAGLPSDVLLVVDQAYAEYLEADEDDGGMELAMAHDNVLVTRTFSKIYGLAGERIGWATGAPHLIDVLNRIRGPFNVTSSGQAAAAAALDDQEFVSRSRDHNAQELARYTAAVEALGNHGLRPIPSKANFLLVLFEGAVTAEQALNAISDAGYAVRHLPGQGLPNALRITIGHRADMDQIAATLRALCGESA